MNKSNNIYEFVENFLKKNILYFFVINMLFVWCTIVVFFYEYFNNILGYILAVISIGISVYSHIIAEDYLDKKYKKKEDQD